MDSMIKSRAGGEYYTHWTEVADRFVHGRDCLAAYVALEAAEVIEGFKPGNLLCLINRLRGGGLNAYDLWRRYGDSVLGETGLKALIMMDRGDSILIYIYREDLLADQLGRKPVRIILGKLGYLEPDRPARALLQLLARTGVRSVPHEIGIFLGYPLKDVLGFMGRVQIRFTCQGPWKIFGDPASSLELAGRFKECRMRMAGRLHGCSSPFSCLKGRVADGYDQYAGSMAKC